MSAEKRQEENYARLVEEMARWGAGQVLWQLDISTAISFVGLLELALRHPNIGGHLANDARQFILSFRDGIPENFPALKETITMWFHEGESMSAEKRQSEKRQSENCARLLHEMRRWGDRPVSWQMDISTAIHFVGLLQLALRHPDVGVSASANPARQFILSFRDGIPENFPALKETITMGFHKRYDA